MRRHAARLLTGVLLLACGALAAGCGSSAPAPAFHPSGGSAGTPASTPAASSSISADGLATPPFGRNVHISMTTWLPSNPSESAAVKVVKNFLLAFLYADYTAGKDRRWAQYIADGTVRSGLAQTLAAKDVTTESFQGKMRIWHMSAVYVPGPKGSVEVTECIDSSHLLNTSLRTGQVLPRHDQSTRDQSLYANTDQLVKAGGQWRIFSIPQPSYYPRAVECK
jgi:hypothetical protein